VQLRCSYPEVYIPRIPARGRACSNCIRESTVYTRRRLIACILHLFKLLLIRDRLSPPPLCLANRINGYIIQPTSRLTATMGLSLRIEVSFLSGFIQEYPRREDLSCMFGLPGFENTGSYASSSIALTLYF